MTIFLIFGASGSQEKSPKLKQKLPNCRDGQSNQSLTFRRRGT